MSDISIIGTGAMGSAIAKALLKAEFEISVWNRSLEKTKPLEKMGARVVPNIEKAIEESPQTIICVNGYGATKSFLNQPRVREVLDGRTIIQFSTGTPMEAADLCDWVNSQGGAYLDGAIMVYPENVGSKEAQILIGGPENIFNLCHDHLTSLGGDIRYLGTNVRAAAALDLAVISRLISITFGTIHGAHICESEDVPVEMLAALYPESDRAHTLAKAIYSNDFSVGGVAVSVNLVEAIASQLQSQAQIAGINSEIPDLFSSLSKRAISAGYSDEDSAAMIKVLRKNDG